MKLLLLALLLQSVGAPSVNIKLLDRASGPTPVTDKDLRPGRPPDCRSAVETQRAVDQVRRGEPGDCWVKDLSAFKAQ